MKLTALFISIPLFVFSQIQTISNQKNFGTDFEDFAHIKVYDGFLYSLNNPGNSAISHDKTILGYGSVDGWFVKMDLNFNVISQTVYGGSGIDVGVDFEKCDNGDFLLLLNSYSDADGNKTVSSYGDGFSADYWLIRVDSLGNILWQKAYGGTGSDIAVDIIKLNEDKFVLFGTSRSPISGNKTVANYGIENGWVIYVDAQGDILDQYIYGGDQIDRFPKASLNDDSTELLFGFSSSSTISGNKTTQLDGVFDGWVITTDTIGNLLNQTSYSNGPNTFTTLRDLKHGINGSIFVGLDGEPGIHGDKTVAGYGTIWNDAWIIKLDENLNELQQFIYGGTSGDGVYSLFRDDSKMILCIASNSGADGNKTEVNFGLGDNWIVCIDTSGNIVWQICAGGAMEEAIFSIQKSGTNEYIVASQTLSGISGNKTVPHYDLGTNDTWFYKLTTTLSVQKTEISDQFQVAPNPFVDEILFSWDQSSQDIGIEIFNSTGQRIEWIQDVQGLAFQWSANNLPKGVYYYTCTSNQGVSKGKIIKQ